MTRLSQNLAISNLLNIHLKLKELKIRGKFVGLARGSL